MAKNKKKNERLTLLGRVSFRVVRLTPIFCVARQKIDSLELVPVPMMDPSIDQSMSDDIEA